MRLDLSKTLPKGLSAMLSLQEIVDESKIEYELLELIKIRASQINGCAYCLDMHTKDSIAIGEDAQRLHLLALWREVPLYSERERAALAWCESLTNISNRGAPDSEYREVERLFSPEEIAELTMAIVVINGWNRLALGFRSEVGNYVSNRESA